jgi:hypothetical protein
MALPVDIADIMRSVATILQALTWDSGDIVFAPNAVAIIPTTPRPRHWTRYAKNLPAALIVEGGQTHEEDAVEIVTSYVHVFIIQKIPQDEKGETSLLSDKGIYAIVAKVIDALLTSDTDFVNEDVIYWVATSGAVPVQEDAPGGPVLKELRFITKHQVIDPS